MIVQALRLQICVAFEHLPIFVACHQRYFFDGKPSLKQPARTLMAQIMEMQVLNAEVQASPMECSSHRFMMMRENSPFAVRDHCLFQDIFPSVIPR